MSDALNKSDYDNLLVLVNRAVQAGVLENGLQDVEAIYKLCIKLKSLSTEEEDGEDTPRIDE